MSRNGSGIMVLPAGNPVSPGTTITSAWANPTMEDLANEITNSLPRDGQAPMTAALKLIDGSVSSPGLAFNSEPSTGLYRVGSSILGLTVGGSQKLRLTSTGAVVTGTLDVSGNTTVGGTLGVTSNATVGGALGVTGTSTLAAVNATNGTFSGTLGVTGTTTLGTANITTANITTAAVSGNATVGGTLGVTGVSSFASGNAGAPGITFTGDTDTGIYRIGTNSLGLTANGSVQFAVSTVNTINRQPLLNQAGSASAPAYAFEGDSNTGIYSQSADVIGFSTAGALTASLGAGVLTLTGASGSNLVINSAAVAIRDINYATNGTNRWTLRVNGTAELGSNAGSDFQLIRRDDAGTSLGPVLDIIRSTGTGQWNGAWAVGNGSLGAPSLTFVNDQDTGFYRAGAGEFRSVVDGSTVFIFGSNANYSRVQFQNSDGTSSNPAYSFENDPDTGIYRATTNDLRIVAGSSGAAGLQVTATTVRPFGAPVRADDGSAGTPIYSFDGDPDTGIYRGGTNSLSIAAGGSVKLGIGTSSITFGSVTMQAQDGTAGAPFYTFEADPDTGMYRWATNSIGFAVGGSQTAGMDANAFYVKDGSTGAPSLSFLNDPDTGMYRVGTNSIGFSCGNGLRLQLNQGNYEVYSANSGSLGTGASFGNGSVGVQLGSSGPGYSALGCNIRFTGTANTYQYHVADTASLIDFHSGGFRFFTAPTGSGGATISFTNVLTLDRASSAAQFLNGSASSPSLTFQSDPDTGFFRAGTNTIGAATSGTERLQIYDGGVYLSTNSFVRAQSDGSASTPLYSFYNDQDTGIYRIGSDTLGFSEGGSGYRVGYRNIPQVNVTGGRTLDLTDMGKSIMLSTNSGQTITIPPNVFGAGDAITLIGNVTSGTHTLARGSGVTLYWAGTNFTNANRTLSNAFCATIYCMANNVFMVSGAGIS